MISLLNDREFMLHLGNFAERVVPEKHALIVRKIALQALRGIVLKTPVDTGRARANWSVSLGSPVSFRTEGTDKTGSSTLSSGREQIMKADPLKQVVWINNNLPYIEALENGHSQQSPLGMVAVTLTEIRAGIS